MPRSETVQQRRPKSRFQRPFRAVPDATGFVIYDATGVKIAEIPAALDPLTFRKNLSQDEAYRVANGLAKILNNPERPPEEAAEPPVERPVWPRSNRWGQIQYGGPKNRETRP